MPNFLKKDALIILEGALESYILSLHGIYLPDLRMRRVKESKYAPILGLLGSTIELLIKSCLVQAKGINIMYREDKSYKFGSESIEEFKVLVRERDSDIEFLWIDNEEPDKVIREILEYCKKFKLIQDLRAKGLHAGVGVSKDIAVIILNDVYRFINTLSTSKRMKPYLKVVPCPEAPIVEREAIIDDLSRRLASAPDLGDKSNLLRAIYIVLPHIPEEEPEWIKAFERISVCPNEDDVTYLVKTLSEAHSIHFYKARGGQGIPIVSDKNNPNAIPISLSVLKREITQIPDQFFSDIGLANGRLKDDILHLPPEDFILDLYTLGIENSKINDGEKFTAQMTWPFIASSISANGTARPYWFIIQNCDELPKLLKFLEDIRDIANGYYKKRIDEVLYGINCLIKNNNLPPDNILTTEMLLYKKSNCPGSYMLPTMIKDRLKKYKGLTHSTVDILKKLINNEMRIGEAIRSLLAVESIDKTNRELVTMLMHFSYKYDDRDGILAILRSDEMNGYWTFARKTMRYNDFVRFGPRTEAFSRYLV